MSTAENIEIENQQLIQQVIDAPVDEKNFIPDETRTALFRKLRSRQDNRTCFDCPARNPTWISLTHGVYVCLVCSGEHRRMGVHLTFVRSVELDGFTKDQCVQMIAGGNAKAKTFWKSHGIECKRKEKDVGGRCVDYADKNAAKHRAEVQKDTIALCKQHGVPMKDKSGNNVGGTGAAAGAGAGAAANTNSNGNLFNKPIDAKKVDDDFFKDMSSMGGASASSAVLPPKPAMSFTAVTANGNGFANGNGHAPAQQAPVTQNLFEQPAPVQPQVMRPAKNPSPQMTFTSGNHFSSGGGNKPTKAKGKKIIDDDDDDLFAGFETEAKRVVPGGDANGRAMETNNTFGLPPAGANTTSPQKPVETANGPSTSTFTPTKDVGGFSMGGYQGGNTSNNNSSAAPASLAGMDGKKGFGSSDVFCDNNNSSGDTYANNSAFSNNSGFGSDQFFGGADPMTQAAPTTFTPAAPTATNNEPEKPTFVSLKNDDAWDDMF